MLVYLLLFLAGIIILLLSAEFFVKLSSRLWLSLRLSPLIIGATVVTVGTTLPELGVSLAASLKSDSGLAIGNIVGSNIINVFLVFAVGIILGNINIGTNKTQKNAFFLLLSTVLYIFLTVFFKAPKISGVIMIISALIYFAAEMLFGIEGREHEDKRFFCKGQKHQRAISLLFSFLLTIFGIFIGGTATVYSIEKIAFLTGWSTTLLGLSVVAIATSLPELLTTVFSRKKDQGKAALGDILGSGIYNLLLIGGLVNIFSPAGTISNKNILVLIFATLCLTGLIFKYAGKLVPKKIGLVLLCFFFIYIFTLK